MGWLTAADLETVVELWPGALDHSAAALGMYLSAAAEQCAAYLGRGEPAQVLDKPFPARWQIAQVMQAKAIALSPLASGNDELGTAYGETVTIFPMDWKVKALLRPAQGVSIA